MFESSPPAITLLHVDVPAAPPLPSAQGLHIRGKYAQSFVVFSAAQPFLSVRGSSIGPKLAFVIASRTRSPSSRTGSMYLR